MRLSINLRFDLKRLTDAELSETLEFAWQRFELAKAAAAPYALSYSWRGPVRHRIAYPICSMLSSEAGFLPSFGLAVEWGIEAIFLRKTQAVLHMHLAICDISDISDEIRRRSAPRRRWLGSWRG